MQRVDAPEILDSDECSANDAQAVLGVLNRINRWFGGVATTQRMVERVATARALEHLSLLEVAAGSGEVPELARQSLALRGIALDVTVLDRAKSHLAVRKAAIEHPARQRRRVVADALALPFDDAAFDLVSCGLFAHHLDARQLAAFVREGWRVCRQALLINDLIRHPLHLALVYASFPLMNNRIAWLDGLASVRRSYIPDEIRDIVCSAFPGRAPQIEISRNYLFRMGLILWKTQNSG